MAKAKPFFIGLDIGGTKMLAAALSPDLKILARARKKSRVDAGGKGPFVSRMCDCVAEAIAEAKLEPSGLAGIGVGSPGPTDTVKGVVIDMPNLGLKDFPLGKRLRAKFGVPVAVENDVNLGTYGEYHFGAARGGRHVLGVFPGTGIGGGIIIDGRIYRGASGAAGEVGHMIVDPDGPLCGCGRHGCLEAFAGRVHIAGQLAGLMTRGQAPHLAESVGTDVRRIRSGPIAQAIQAGDGLVEEVVRREARRVGVAVASVVNVLSPDTVVLGGGQVEAMGRLFLEEVKAAVARWAMPFIARFVKVVRAELGDDAVVLGAGQLIAERLRAKEK